MQTTSLIKEILWHTHTKISPLIIDADPSTHIFLTSVHDWLVCLSSGQYQWQDYGLTWKKAIIDYLPHDQKIIGWINQLSSSIDPHHDLLVKHYLIEYVIDQDIFTSLSDPSFYTLMLCAMGRDPYYYPHWSAHLWDGIFDNPFPINDLRSRQSLRRTYLQQLARRDDETDHRVQTDHGLLASFSLVYAIHLVLVILDYQLYVTPSDSLTVIRHSFRNTLFHLKGVLSHAQGEWLGIDVR